jgi:hypothetical protein
MEGTAEVELVERGSSSRPTGSWRPEADHVRVRHLIANTDRNQGNLLIDDRWNIWLIDHTRAFRRTSSSCTERLSTCERGL